MSDAADDHVGHDGLLDAAIVRFGDLIHITGYETASIPERIAIDVHLHDLSLILVPVAHRTIEAGLGGIFIGPGSITELDDMEFLRSVQPVGWRPDTTYAQVSGVYDRRRKFIVVGTTGQSPHAQHTMLHEFGHAVGDLLNLNDADIIGNHHGDARFWTQLPPYFRGSYPGDPRGQREMVAELFRDRILNERNMHRRWGTELVAWLEQELDLL